MNEAERLKTIYITILCLEKEVTELTCILINELESSDENVKQLRKMIIEKMENTKQSIDLLMK